MKKERHERYTEITEKMKNLIYKSGSKVTHVAEMVGITQPAMSQWMSGRSTMNLESFILLSDFFGVRIIFPDDKAEVVENIAKEENIGVLKLALEREKQKVIKLEGQVEILQNMLREQMQRKLEMEQGSLLGVK